MIEELTGRRDRKPISSVIGRVLGGIADRPVELEDAARGIIRARTLHGNVELRVEVLGKSNGTNCSNHPQDRPAGGAFAPPNSGSLRNDLPEGGTNAPPGDRLQALDEVFSDAAPANANATQDSETFVASWKRDEIEELRARYPKWTAKRIARETGQTIAMVEAVLREQIQ
jgi:hypothetical protein